MTKIDVIQEAKDLKVMVGSNGCYTELETPDSNGKKIRVSLPFGTVKAIYDERLSEYIIYSEGKKDNGAFDNKILWGLIGIDGEVLIDDFYKDIQLIDDPIDPKLSNRFLELRIGTEKDYGQLSIYDLDKEAFLPTPPIERYDFFSNNKILVQTFDYPNRARLVCHLIDLNDNKVLASDFAFVVEYNKCGERQLSILSQDDTRLFERCFVFRSYGIKPFIYDSGIGFEIIDPFRGKVISRVHINEMGD